jgi:hypothetical protein
MVCWAIDRERKRQQQAIMVDVPYNKCLGAEKGEKMLLQGVGQSGFDQRNRTHGNMRFVAKSWLVCLEDLVRHSEI